MIAATSGSRTDDDGRWTISSTIHAGTARHDVWYRGPGERPGHAGDAWLAASLVPAMRAGGELHILGTGASASLVQSTSVIQDIVHSWDSRFRRVAIKVEADRRAQRTEGRGVGCFFTGGVDSFYTLLKHRDEITHLVFVHGFDVPLANRPLRSQVAHAITEIAAALDKRLIEVETNLRDFSDAYARWDLHYHGAALASAAHLLAGSVRKVYIAASFAYSGLFPWGSHPLLDPLWSGDALELVHDGCEATRLEKVLLIAKCDTALEHLRVCFENRDGRYNCGRCPKCLRTMASLRLAGVLDRCATFAAPLDLRAVARAGVPEYARGFLRENLDAAEGWGRDPALARALRESLHGRRLTRRWLQ